MQPKTNTKFDPETFSRLVRNIKNISESKKNIKNNFQNLPDLPGEVGFQINYQCNLRCKTCFLWNEEGRHNSLTKDKVKDELELDAFAKVLKSTEKAKSNLFFWGTEPLLHSEWDSMSKLLEKDCRWTVICTNGILIEKHFESLSRISENTAIVISLDGFEDSHDSIRGHGNFRKTIKNIELLLDAKNKFKGQVSLHCVLNDKNVFEMHDILSYFEGYPINTFYFAFPWYISNSSACEMDRYFNSNFSGLFPGQEGEKSWHTYTFRLNNDIIPELEKQISRINSKVWPWRIRFQPALEKEDLPDFINGGTQPGKYRKNCFALQNRIDILANGDMIACQPYPEFKVGNIYTDELPDVWNNKVFNEFRQKMVNKLMPACSKCILLYLNGY